MDVEAKVRQATATEHPAGQGPGGRLLVKEAPHAGRSVHVPAMVQRDVQEELDWEPSIRTEEIGVTVTGDGTVTLTGQVHSWAEKFLAERVAKRVAGVRGVVNELQVRIPDARRRDDTELAATAAHSLEWNVSVPEDSVQVKVENGWITLEGTVEWRYQREAAEGAVRDLIGVRGVTDAIVVRPGIADPREVHRRIETALRRSADIDAGRIAVTVADGKVSLRGSVRSWAEREDAERAAWAARGVREVENAILVEPSPGPPQEP